MSDTRELQWYHRSGKSGKYDPRHRLRRRRHKNHWIREYMKWKPCLWCWLRAMLTMMESSSDLHPKLCLRSKLCFWRWENVKHVQFPLFILYSLVSDFFRHLIGKNCRCGWKSWPNRLQTKSDLISQYGNWNESWIHAFANEIDCTTFGQTQLNSFA